MNPVIFNLSLIEIITLLSVFFLFTFETVYWCRLFGQVAFFNPPSSPVVDRQPVSIILSARNEYEMLRKNLPVILTQEYPQFEVIAVNDGSDDDTETLLASMQAQYPHLVFRTIVKDEKFRHSKKMALGIGIKAARYDLLLFTDADCYPAGNTWLQSMQQHFTDKTAVVIGYTRLTNTAQWIRADHFMQSLHMLGKALRQKPYKGKNSNLAWRKPLFFDNKGFDLRITGDLREDLVFVNKVANAQNTAVALGAAATTISTLRYTAGSWRRGRINELQSLGLTERGTKYPMAHELTGRLLFFISAGSALSLFFPHPLIWFSVWGLLAVRLAFNTLLLLKALKRLGEPQLLPTLWLWDVLAPLYYIYLLLASHFRNQKTWR